MPNVETIAANMRRAFIDRKSAKIGGGLFTPEELRDAAFVLRAAPDLLAALEALLNYQNLGAYDRAAAVIQARAVIAKAKGAQQ